MYDREPIKLLRACEAVMIPAGTRVLIPEGTEVNVAQSLGGSFTVYVDGNLLRIAGKDADALGREVQEIPKLPDNPSDAEVEKLVWEQLKTCYDPEIPVNIWDLGLIYDITIVDGVVNVKMTLTAVGCSLGPQIIAEIESKLLGIDGVENAAVEMVWNPPWSPERLTDDGRLSLQAMGFSV